MAGSGQRHVKPTVVFFGLLHLGSLLRGFEFIGTDIDHPGISQARHSCVGCGEGAATPDDPQEGAEHHRVLQALGPVDGVELHGGGIGLQTHQSAFASGIPEGLGSIGNLAGQPGGQRFNASEPTLETALQKHPDLSPVGDTPFAIRATQVSGRHLAAHDPPKQWSQGADPSEFLLGLEEPLERLSLQGWMGLDLQDVSR